MLSFNKSLEKPQSTTTPDNQKPEFNLLNYRNGLRALVLSLVVMTSGCQEKPKETQNIPALTQEQSEQVEFRREYDECVLKLKELRPSLDKAWDKQDLKLHAKLLKEYKKIENRRTDIYYYDLKRK